MGNQTPSSWIRTRANHHWDIHRDLSPPINEKRLNVQYNPMNFTVCSTQNKLDSLYSEKMLRMASNCFACARSMESKPCALPINKLESSNRACKLLILEVPVGDLWTLNLLPIITIIWCSKAEMRHSVSKLRKLQCRTGTGRPILASNSYHAYQYIAVL